MILTASPGGPFLVALVVAAFIALVIALYTWAVRKGKRHLADHLLAHNIDAAATSFRLFPPVRLFLHSRRHDMWFTITLPDGKTAYARVRRSVITGNSVELFE